jgi:hypothetical protein
MSRASMLLAVLLTLLCPADGDEAQSFTGPPDHPPAHQDIRHAVETLLQATAAYVAPYERELMSVVAEEDYSQRLGASATSSRSRGHRLRGDHPPPS